MIYLSGFYTRNKKTVKKCVHDEGSFKKLARTSILLHYMICVINYNKPCWCITDFKSGYAFAIYQSNFVCVTVQLDASTIFNLIILCVYNFFFQDNFNLSRQCINFKVMEGLMLSRPYLLFMQQM